MRADSNRLLRLRLALHHCSSQLQVSAGSCSIDRVFPADADGSCSLPANMTCPSKCKRCAVIPLQCTFDGNCPCIRMLLHYCSLFEFQRSIKAAFLLTATRIDS